MLNLLKTITLANQTWVKPSQPFQEASSPLTLLFKLGNEGMSHTWITTYGSLVSHTIHIFESALAMCKLSLLICVSACSQYAGSFSTCV